MRVHTPTRRRAAFTMTELLVVISIIVLMIAIAVPALSGLMGSSERSMSENQLKGAIAAARDAAIQSETGDAAAVFIFTATNGVGRITVVPCIAVGQIINDCVDGNADNVVPGNNARPRDVFVPIPNIAPVQLPRGWSVRAYAAPGTMFEGTGNGQQPERWYEAYAAAAGAPTAGEGRWVFPETAFYDSGPTGFRNGTVRQSFMVRFKVGTGALDTSSGNTALVFDPVQESGFRGAAPYSTYRADQLRIDDKIAPNAAVWMRRILRDRPEFQDLPPATTNLVTLRKLVGDASLDMVLVRPVTELALYQEQKMAASIGAASLNRVTGSIYGDPATPTDLPLVPMIDTSLFPGLTAAEVNSRVTKWIEGHYRVNDLQSGDLVASDARVFTVEHYLGQAQELVP